MLPPGSITLGVLCSLCLHVPAHDELRCVQGKSFFPSCTQQAILAEVPGPRWVLRPPCWAGKRQALLVSSLMPFIKEPASSGVHRCQRAVSAGQESVGYKRIANFVGVSVHCTDDIDVGFPAADRQAQ